MSIQPVPLAAMQESAKSVWTVPTNSNLCSGKVLCVCRRLCASHVSKAFPLLEIRFVRRWSVWACYHVIQSEPGGRDFMAPLSPGPISSHKCFMVLWPAYANLPVF